MRCTFEPSGFFSVMLKPGPTTPVSVTLGAWEEPVAAVGIETATATTALMSSVRSMTLPSLRPNRRIGFTQAAGPAGR